MSNDLTYRPELVVYVVWHPSFAKGREFAEFLSDRLTRDANEPLSRGLQIPVYLRTGSASDQLPKPIPFDHAQHTIVVLLVDLKMTTRIFKSREKRWRSAHAEIQRVSAERIATGHFF
jgi:hypothetical protein